MEYREQDFHGVAVALDGNTFVRCSFDDAILHYAGGPVLMESCHYNRLVWAFEGPVSEAIRLIAGIYETQPETAIKIWRTAMFGDGSPIVIG